MTKVLYSEQQSFRQVRWIWFIVIPVFAATLIFMLQALYQQLGTGEPWGNEPMSDSGLIAMTLFLVVTHAIMFWFLLSIRLELEVSSTELRYRFFSFTKWNVLSTTEISDYTFEKQGFWRKHGYRKKLLAKTTRMNIVGDYLISIKTLDGRTILMSTTNKEGLERAMQKLMSKSQNT